LHAEGGAARRPVERQARTLAGRRPILRDQQHDVRGRERARHAEADAADQLLALARVDQLLRLMLGQRSDGGRVTEAGGIRRLIVSPLIFAPLKAAGLIREGFSTLL